MAAMGAKKTPITRIPSANGLITTTKNNKPAAQAANKIKAVNVAAFVALRSRTGGKGGCTVSPYLSTDSSTAGDENRTHLPANQGSWTR
ncbi:MAG: hypothetical protein JWM11_6451 [Planctomycetaceae bacterium]|nr:hypothetical protein [Planctomycetaceae bacterium]